MPRNVRNFWIELEVDGKKHRIATGPRSASGGFTLRVYMREGGGIADDVLRVRGDVSGDDELVLSAVLGDEALRKKTWR